MEFRVGDSVFNAHGQVGVIKEQHPDKGEYSIDREKSVKEGPNKFGFINGLSEIDRKSFQEIMSRVQALPNHEERATELQKLVQELTGDGKSLPLQRYLQAELSHLMHSAGIKQNNYSISEIAVQG